MSTLKVNNLQVGQDGTAANNYTLYQPASPDGTVRLGYGVAGSVTDILTLKNSRLGIGTDNPGYKLHIGDGTSQANLRLQSGNSDISLLSMVGGTSQTCRIEFGDSSDDDIGKIYYDNSDNSMQFTTNTEERLRITSAGLVDISGGIQVSENVTPTTGSGVEIFKASSTVGQISAYNRDSSAWMDLRLKGNQIELFAGGSERLRIASDGKIGINNNAPLYAMHFKNAMSSSPSFIHMEVTGSNAVGGGGGIAFDTSASNALSNNGLYLATISGVRNSADDGSNDLVFKTSKSGVAGDDGNTHSPKERLRIASDGKLSLTGSAANMEYLRMGGNNDRGLRFTSSSGSSSVGVVHTINAPGDGGAQGEIVFQTNSGERLRITSSGSVGINETSPSAILDVKGTISAGAGTNEDLQQWNIGSNNVKAEIKYVDAAANRGMLFGTTTDHILAFQTNNAERLRIDSAGRMGLGANNPGDYDAEANDLVVRSANHTGITIASSGSNQRCNLYFSDGTSGSEKYRGAFTYDHSDDSMMMRTGGVERLRIRSNGDLILGPYDAPGAYTSTANNVPYQIKVAPYGWQHHSELAAISMGNHSGSTGNDDGEIVFKTTQNAHSSTAGLTERLRITSSGLVRVGHPTANHSSNVTQDLEIKGRYVNGAGNFSRLIFGNSDDSGGSTASIRAERNGNNFGTELTFFTNPQSSSGDGLERLRIDRNGELKTQLKITMRENAIDAFSFHSNGANGYFRLTDEYDNVELMRFHGDGALSINTTNLTNYSQTSNSLNTNNAGGAAGNWSWRRDTGAVIQATDADSGWALMYLNKYEWNSGDDNRWISFYLNGQVKDTINWNGSSIIYGQGSDYRVKENIREFTNGIDKVKQLKVHLYDYIDPDRGTDHIGFIAHELQEIIPDAVSGEKDGMRKEEDTGNDVMDIQMVDYGKLTPVLTAALQEALAKIETLEARITALEG